jgi:hypothetical protein
MPARYAKPEEHSGIVASLESYQYAIDRPAPDKTAAAPEAANPDAASRAPASTEEAGAQTPVAVDGGQAVASSASESKSVTPAPAADAGKRSMDEPDAKVPGAAVQ